MADIAENMREGLLAGRRRRPAGHAGDDGGRRERAGRGEGQARLERTAVRRGCERGSVTPGGAVPVTRPRVRAADGSGELPVASYELFSSTEILGKMAMEKMPAGLSTRRSRSGWSRSASGLPKRPRQQANRRSPAGLWR